MLLFVYTPRPSELWPIVMHSHTGLPLQPSCCNARIVPVKGRNLDIATSKCIVTNWKYFWVLWWKQKACIRVFREERGKRKSLHVYFYLGIYHYSPFPFFWQMIWQLTDTCCASKDFTVLIMCNLKKNRTFSRILPLINYNCILIGDLFSITFEGTKYVCMFCL